MFNPLETYGIQRKLNEGVSTFVGDSLGIDSVSLRHNTMVQRRLLTIRSVTNASCFSELLSHMFWLTESD